MDQMAGFVILALILAFIILLFLIFRNFVCWYWKINQMVYFLEYNVNLQKLILKELRIANGTGGDETKEVEAEEKTATAS